MCGSTCELLLLWCKQIQHSLGHVHKITKKKHYASEDIKYKHKKQKVAANVKDKQKNKAFFKTFCGSA